MKNVVSLIGRIGSDIRTGTTQSGTQYANFSLATSEKYKDKDNNWKENTEWHNISILGGRAKVAEYLAKGLLVAVDGKLQTRKRKDQNGVETNQTSIMAEHVYLINQKEQKPKVDKPKHEMIDENYDDIPF